MASRRSTNPLRQSKRGRSSSQTPPAKAKVRHISRAEMERLLHAIGFTETNNAAYKAALAGNPMHIDGVTYQAPRVESELPLYWRSTGKDWDEIQAMNRAHAELVVQSNARKAAKSERKKPRAPGKLRQNVLDFLDENRELLRPESYEFKVALARFEADGYSTDGFSPDNLRKTFARARKEKLGQIAR